jgi:uncharacterized membrane protein YccC
MAAKSAKKWWRPERKELIHAGTSTIAAVASILVARLCRLPESYWAAVTTLVVMQSTLGGAWSISKQRFAGTAIGAAMGALLATYFGMNTVVYGAGIFAAGVICAVLGLERNAYRYTGITLTIILMVARTDPAWIIAIHRFVEISIGIAVGLAVTAILPEEKLAGASTD